MCGKSVLSGKRTPRTPQRPEAENKGHFWSRKGALQLVSREHGRVEQILAVMEFRLGGRVEDT